MGNHGIMIQPLDLLDNDHDSRALEVMFVGLYPSLAIAITPIQQSLELCATSRTLGHPFELGFHGYLSFTQLGKWLSSPQLWNTKWKNPQLWVFFTRLRNAVKQQTTNDHGLVQNWAKQFMGFQDLSRGYNGF